MNELIKINNENKVDGRSLYEFLQVKTPYTGSSSAKFKVSDLWKIPEGRNG